MAGPNSGDSASWLKNSKEPTSRYSSRCSASVKSSNQPCCLVRPHPASQRVPEPEERAGEQHVHGETPHAGRPGGEQSAPMNALQLEPPDVRDRLFRELFRDLRTRAGRSSISQVFWSISTSRRAVALFVSLVAMTRA